MFTSARPPRRWAPALSSLHRNDIAGADDLRRRFCFLHSQTRRRDRHDPAHGGGPVPVLPTPTRKEANCLRNCALGVVLRLGKEVLDGRGYAGGGWCSAIHSKDSKRTSECETKPITAGPPGTSPRYRPRTRSVAAFWQSPRARRPQPSGRNPACQT